MLETEILETGIVAYMTGYSQSENLNLKKYFTLPINNEDRKANAPLNSYPG